MDDAAGPGDTPREPGPGQTGAPAAAPGPEPRPAAGLTAEAARALLAGWLAAWEAKDEEAYFSFYAPDFHFKDLNLHLSSFRRYRSRRFREAGAISVRASDVEVSVSGDRARLSFSQRYQSDRHVDQGLKTLELGAGDGQWRIIAETFQARP
ncbi:MAG: nuclear transport factor 2 family protein [Deltaproteobacteria bacterium]|jgi:ketosteroid isomerase-like protein|nr:nuclear transport factor 2 family protein [Deltaproteobacteria bacterium]